MNLMVLHGKLGNDPELKYTAPGTPVCKFSLATNEYINKVKTTVWHRIVAWGKMAETSSKYLKKGSEIVLYGRLSYNEWTKDGVKRKDAEIVMFSMDFCGGGRSQGQGQSSEPDIPF